MARNSGIEVFAGFTRDEQQAARHSVALLLGRKSILFMRRFPESKFGGHPESTFAHSVRVGALMARAVVEFGDSTQRAERVETARSVGTLHDWGKFITDGVMSLIHLPRRVSDEERAHIGLHAPRGGEDLGRTLAERPPQTAHHRRILGFAAYVAAHHHSPIPGQLSNEEDHRVAMGLNTLTRVADAADAMLVDPTREYRQDRFRSEGLIDAAGRLNMNGIWEKILSGFPEVAFGVPLAGVVDLACDLMPIAV